MVDMDAKEVSFTLNGEGQRVGMGFAFSGDGFRPCGGVYPVVSFNRHEKLRLSLGGKGCSPFKYPPPDGFRGVGDAVFAAVDELDSILEKVLIWDLFCFEREVFATLFLTLSILSRRF